MQTGLFVHTKLLKPYFGMCVYYTKFERRGGGFIMNLRQ